MYVFDATPSIYLAKAERISLVDQLPADCTMPERVFEEVVTTGIEAGHADARRIERVVERGAITVQPAAEGDKFERLADNENLSEADAAVLALAAAHEGTAVVDEAYGRAVADSEGITTRGTAYLVLELLAEGVVDADVARNTIDAMLDAGWYCAPDLYAKILRRIEELG